MNHLTVQQLQILQKSLGHEQENLQHRLDYNDQYGLSNSFKDSVGELSSYDNHPADLGTENFERQKDFALMEDLRSEIIEVEQALDRINQGSYGICVIGGEPIAFERLQAVPATKYCKEHSPVQRHSERRPIEEQFLNPPFGRTSLDEQEQTQFDGEDAWQIVEKWGTSDSPAMAENREIDDINDDYSHFSIESDENDGYVEPLESFLAADIHGKLISVVRNLEYLRYMANGEGDPLLEPDQDEDNPE